ncbi:hypothetical protein KIN20_020809 [Parelaphostrongylus tenuis]|uniref:Uncharacterized protein n=1 Tax=Parelaphostrongylus tenuis TaxID=148309 RepID=A0AAD5MN15_PARTN|nr:hypothetical protein KIN20_020809 [Parelaphostrongylus tenuis]
MKHGKESQCSQNRIDARTSWNLIRRGKFDLKDERSHRSVSLANDDELQALVEENACKTVRSLRTQSST